MELSEIIEKLEKLKETEGENIQIVAINIDQYDITVVYENGSWIEKFTY